MSTSTLCFDATGTLITISEPVGEVYAQVAHEFGIDIPGWRLDDAFRRILRQAPTPGVIRKIATAEERRRDEFEWWSERIRQTFQAADSTIHFANFQDFSTTLFDTYSERKRWRVLPGVCDTLDQLADRNLDMIVVSDFDHRLETILQVLEMDHYFKFVLIPSKTHHRKPDRRIFEIASERLGIAIEAMAYIGDDDREVLAGIAAHGVRTLDVRLLSTFHALTEEFATPATLSGSSPISPKPPSSSA